MTSFATRWLLSIAVALPLAAALPAIARNESFHKPIDKALAKKKAREIVGDLPLRWGSASASGSELIPGEVEAQGAASIFNDDPHVREHLSDEQTCQRAFEEALIRLVDQARREGAEAVVGIVSAFKGEVVDDPRAYDCHAGSTKSYVTLRGRLARTYTQASSRPLPPATDFAALDDVKAVPISAAGQERYAHFLTLPKPRAFAVYEDGSWRFYAKDPEAMTRTLDFCARQGKRCWLYAVDDRVVWSTDVNKRIGSSSQLGGGNAPVDPKDEHQ